MKYFTRLSYFLQEQWLLFVLSRSLVTIALSVGLVLSVIAAFHFNLGYTHPRIMLIPYSCLGIAVAVVLGFLDGSGRKNTPLIERAHKILKGRGEILPPGQMSSFTAFLVCSIWGEQEKTAHEAAVLSSQTPKPEASMNKRARL